MHTQTQRVVSKPVEEIVNNSKTLPKLILPTGRDYSMVKFVQHMRMHGKADGTALVYASLIRTALRSLKSTKLEDIVSYCATGKMNRSFPAAWNLFAPYMRGQGYDVDSIPTTRDVNRALGPLPDPHPQLDNIMIIVRLALKRHYKLTTPLRIGDFMNGRYGIGISEVDDFMSATPLNETQTKALLELLSWGWGHAVLPDRGQNGEFDPRSLLIVRPLIDTPLSVRQLRELAEFDGDTRVKVRLRDAQTVQMSRGFNETPLPDPAGAPSIVEGMLPDDTFS